LQLDVVFGRGRSAEDRVFGVEEAAVLRTGEDEGEEENQRAIFHRRKITAF